MKTLLFIIIIVFAASSCISILSDEENNENICLAGICDTQDPLNDLKWLNDKIKSYDSAWYTHVDVAVYQASYKGITVFYTIICCPFCGMTPPEIRNCEGQILGYLGDDIPNNAVKNAKIVWRTNNNVCTF